MRFLRPRILMALSSLPMVATGLDSQEPLRFELIEGSRLAHEWGETDEFCLGGGFVEVPIRGTFDVNLTQRMDSIECRIDAIDFVSTTGPEYRVSGKGVYSEERSLASPTAEPPNWILVEFAVDVSGMDAILSTEPAVTVSAFPAIEVGVATLLLHRRDCFTLGIKAKPIQEDSLRFFRRGDTTGDGRRNVTDAVSVLLYLFMGAEEPSCLDSTDVDDDGIVGITDAIYLLGHLFLGGPFPPLPATFCGLDLTDDPLGCRGQEGCMPWSAEE